MAIDAVSNSQVASSAANVQVFTFINRDDSSDRSYEDCAIDTLLDLQAVYVDANIYVGVFAANDADIFPRRLVGHVSNGDTLV